MFMSTHMFPCMYKLEVFLCCCNFISELSELLETGSSSGRKGERKIINFERMKWMRYERTNGRSHRSINTKCQDNTWGNDNCYRRLLNTIVIPFWCSSRLG